MIKFGNLYDNIGDPYPNGKTKNRSIPVPIDKRGGRLRASMLTDHYDTYFERMQLKGNYIPLDFFHSCRHGDEIMKNIIDIHLGQQKYEKMNILEFWSQSELRKQVESYYREMKTMKTKRSNDKDLQQIVAWWYDADIGIKKRIERYNDSFFVSIQSFQFDEEITPILGEKRIRHSPAPPLENVVNLNLDDAMDLILQSSETEIYGKINDGTTTTTSYTNVVPESSENMLTEHILFEYYEI